jgi:hypothetical protein
LPSYLDLNNICSPFQESNTNAVNLIDCFGICCYIEAQQIAFAEKIAMRLLQIIFSIIWILGYLGNTVLFVYTEWSILQKSFIVPER